MARNGSGTASLLNTIAPPGQVNNPTNINATMADIASMLTDSINKDGTKPFAANQPMAGFKITGSAVGSAASDLARVDQAQNGVIAHATSVSGVDTITLGFTPTLAAFPAKSKIRWTSAGVNTTTTPTITADGFGPYTIKKGALAALAANDLGAAGQINEGVFDGTQILLTSHIQSAAASGSITTSGYTQTTARLLGRTTASTGAIEEITVGSGLTLSAGSLTASGSSAPVPHVIVHTSGTTFTTNVNTKWTEVIVIGGGGAGGTSNSNGAVASGGGAGGWASKIYTTLAPSTGYTYAVGAAGANSTFTDGTTLITGLAGSAGASIAATPGAVTGGLGGSATNGDITVNGDAGGPAMMTAGTYGLAGAGGSNKWSAGGRSVSGTANASGVSGFGYGAGGSGGISVTGGGAGAGGAGNAGAVITIEWY